MNNKKAKSIRKAVREMSRDQRDVKLAGGATYAEYKNHVGPLGGDRALLPNCGRALYKSLKRAVLRGAVA